jgi:hypothetical protein
MQEDRKKSFEDFSQQPWEPGGWKEDHLPKGED